MRPSTAGAEVAGGVPERLAPLRVVMGATEAVADGVGAMEATAEEVRVVEATAARVRSMEIALRMSTMVAAEGLGAVGSTLRLADSSSLIDFAACWNAAAKDWRMDSGLEVEVRGLRRVRISTYERRRTPEVAAGARAREATANDPAASWRSG